MTERLRVLVFYGGDAATNPRNELLAWLRGPDIDVDARIVADDSPHAEGVVFGRVEDAIDWADKAIALFTPDSRSTVGAPNVIDEVGRWIGKKRTRDLCVLRQQGVDVYSNHAGVVYVAFQDRVSEKFFPLSKFPKDVGEKPAEDPPRGVVADGNQAPNLTIKRKFNDHDRDEFLEDSYEQIARYFSASLGELKKQNAHMRIPTCTCAEPASNSAFPWSTARPPR